MNKGQNPDLLAAFNDGLAKLKANGEYQRLLDTYLKAPPAAATSFWELLAQSMPALLSGLGNTLLVTVISFAFAMLLGL
ncbi:hypothetical protein LXJ57_25725, partial [Escherichia coli]|nr:hypothetical protein [Escherichia coli]